MTAEEKAQHDEKAAVIVPTYNRADLIVDSLNSVYRQTYRPIEVVVVDDGSEDATEKVVKTWAKEHQQAGFDVRYIYQEHAGAPVARNTGMKHAKGRYLQFFDSDDILLPQKLSRQIRTMKRENTPICICDYSHVDSEGNFLREKSNDRTLNEILQSVFRLSTLISVIDRPYFEKRIPLRWNPKLLKFQDRDFHHKLFMVTDRFSYVDEILFQYVRYSENSIFQSVQRIRKIHRAYLSSLLRFHIRYFYKISFKKW